MGNMQDFYAENPTESGTTGSKFDDPVSEDKLQEKLAKRAAEHEIRDKRRQRSEDTDAYVNGVLFGFDPNMPLEEQVEGWKSADKPEPEQLAELGLAGKAWLKQEQRHMGGGN